MVVAFSAAAHIGDLPLKDDQRGAKAEAVAVLDIKPGALTVLALFDGIANGAPTRYRVALPAGFAR